MRKYLKNLYLPAMLGASIEYYDIALYGYMAPVLVQVFFPYLEKTTAYFFYFLFEFFASIAQLFGAYFFGNIGDKYGRKPAMYNSMMGISIITFMICLLPTYNQIGILATFFFMIMRMLQSFFLGGEYNGGAIYLLEHEKNKRQHAIISGLYCAFTVGGIITASIVAFICNKIGPEYFRIAYALSFLMALLAYQMRKKLVETPSYINTSNKHTSGKVKVLITQVVIASLFFGIIYGLPTRVFNALLPIAINISSNDIMILNTACLILYASLLIIVGILGKKYGSQRLMQLATIAACLVSYPLMFLIKSGYWGYIIFAKIIFTILAATFISPFHAWAQKLSTADTRYKSISTSYAIGKCLSTVLLACSFLIYDYTHSLTILGLILSFIAIITVRFAL